MTTHIGWFAITTTTTVTHDTLWTTTTSEEQEADGNTGRSVERKTIEPAQVRVVQPMYRQDAHGATFRCVVDARWLCHVKVPNRMLPWIKNGTLPPKVLPFGLNPEEIQPFLDEVREASGLIEPTDVPPMALAQFYEGLDALREDAGYAHIHRILHFELAPYPMLFMEAYDTTLADMIVGHGKLTPHAWCLLAVQLTGALDYAHGRGRVLSTAPEHVALRRNVPTPDLPDLPEYCALLSSSEARGTACHTDAQRVASLRALAKMLFELTGGPDSMSALLVQIVAEPDDARCLRHFGRLRVALLMALFPLQK